MIACGDTGDRDAEVHILREGEAAKSISEVCRKHGVAGETYHRRRAMFAGIEAPVW